MSPDVIYAGLSSGAVYGLVALGLTIIYKPTHILNFAQGEAVVLGAIGAYQGIALWRLNWFAALGLVIGGTVVLAVVTERLTVFPAKRSGTHYGWIIASFAVTLIIEAVYNLIYTTVPSFNVSPIIAGKVPFLGDHITWQQLVIILVAVFGAVAYGVFLRRSMYGLAIRAISHNQDTAIIMGIPVAAVVLVSFVVGMVLTASAGFLASSELFILPTSGLLFTIKGFIATVVGGLGSPMGAVVGGFTVGLLDTVLRSQISGSVGNFVVFGVLAVMLLVFPSGIFGKKVEVRT